jgi:hypothetical protein
MAVAEDIIAARACGVVHCGMSVLPTPSLPELAREFGLADAPASYREISADQANRLVRLVLSQDTAYNSEVMPANRAAELADRFLAQFGGNGVHYFTNGNFHEAPGPKLLWTGVQWNPVTTATFDTGVLVIGPKCSGCLWVEDED